MRYSEPSSALIISSLLYRYLVHHVHALETINNSKDQFDFLVQVNYKHQDLEFLLEFLYLS